MAAKSAGQAEAILRTAEATAKGIHSISGAITERGGGEAATMRIAEQYLAAFGNIAKSGTTLLLPTNAADPASMVAQALSVYRSIGAASPLVSPGCALNRAP